MELQLLIKLLPIIFRAINAAPQIQQAIRIGTPIDKAVEENAGDLLPLLGEIGKQMFPGIDDRFAPAAAASTMFDPIRVKWLQTALNVSVSTHHSMSMASTVQGQKMPSSSSKRRTRWWLTVGPAISHTPRCSLRCRISQHQEGSRKFQARGSPKRAKSPIR
jgi:hypothetical protein